MGKAVTGFQESLAIGQLAESEIARWIISRGGSVLPIYEVEIGRGKGPRLFTPRESLVAPDILVIKYGKISWIEAKHKTVFSWHRLTRRWVTGIDQHHYEQYKKVQDHLNWPVWLLFLHRQSVPDKRDLNFGCPSECPTGLFGEQLSVLASKTNHYSGKWGKGGMIYWDWGSLKMLAELTEIDIDQPPDKV